MFLKHFVCRLVIFGFLDLKKDHRQQRVFATRRLSARLVRAGTAALRAVPGLGHAAQPGCRRHGNQPRHRRGRPRRAGDAGELELPKLSTGAGSRPFAFIRIDDVELSFNPRPRDDRVTV